MCKSAVIIALMVAMALAASPRGQQGRGGESQPEGQIEGYDPEDSSSMASKIMECRSILQQAGMIDMSTPGKDGESENETEEPKKMEERMGEGGAGKSRRGFRRY